MGKAGPGWAWERRTFPRARLTAASFPPLRHCSVISSWQLLLVPETKWGLLPRKLTHSACVHLSPHLAPHPGRETPVLTVGCLQDDSFTVRPDTRGVEGLDPGIVGAVEMETVDGAQSLLADIHLLRESQDCRLGSLPSATRRHRARPSYGIRNIWVSRHRSTAMFTDPH